MVYITAPMLPVFGNAFVPAFGNGGKFSPVDVPSLAAWYDPSDLTTLFQDAAGTVPADTDGDTIRLMLDKSGNGNDAAYGTTLPPVLRISGGKVWLEISDSGGFIVPSNTFGTLAYSVFVGFGKTVNVANQTSSFPHFWRTGTDSQSFFMRSGNDRLDLKAVRDGGTDVRPIVYGFNALHSIGDRNVINAEAGLTSSAIILDGSIASTEDNTGTAMTGLTGTSELMSNILGDFFGAVLLDDLAGPSNRFKINAYLAGKF